MKAIVLIHADGSQFIAGFVPRDFDTQAWAEKRRAAFTLLNVTHAQEQLSAD